MPLDLKETMKIDQKQLKRRLFPVTIAIFLAFFMTFPAFLATNAVSRQLSAVRVSIATAYRSVTLLPTLKEEQERLGKFIYDTKQSLFNEDEVGDFVADISEQAGRFGVQITSSRPNRLLDYVDPAFQEIYEAFEFAIDLEADFHGLVKLLATLYQKPKIFKIREMTITGRETETDLNQITLSLIIISAKGTQKSVDQNL